MNTSPTIFSVDSDQSQEPLLQTESEDSQLDENEPLKNEIEASKQESTHNNVWSLPCKAQVVMYDDTVR